MKVNYDLKALAQAARDAGFVVAENSRCYGYYKGDCGLVISSRRHSYQMGFVTNEKGQMEMVYDEDGSVLVKKDMAETIMPRYLERVNQQNGGRTRQCSRVDTGKFVELRYREA
jgi:hypothetical protein